MNHPTYRIVVGVDLSEPADLALERAFRLASKEEKAEVHVIQAVQHLGEFVQIDLPESPGFRLPLHEAQQRLEAHVGGKLAEWQDKTGATFSRLVSHISVEFPAAAIAQLGADLEADLVVVGTHGRQGFRRFLLGSVAEAVVRLAQSPVLVVRPSGDQGAVPEIQPPCALCVETRKAGQGEFWCEQHREKHGQRHTYHYDDRVSNSGNVSGLMKAR